MQVRFICGVAIAQALLGSICAISTVGAPVTGWHIDDLLSTFPPSRTVGLSGADTDSPIVGDGTAENARQVAIWATFPEVRLSHGQTIHLSGELEASFVSLQPFAFRWGLFRESAAGPPDAFSGWHGFLVSGDFGGFIWEKHPMPPRTFATITDGVSVPGGNFLGGRIESDDPIRFDLFLTRDGNGLDIRATAFRVRPPAFPSFSTLVFSMADDHIPLPQLDFSFNRVGLLSANGWLVNQVRLYNVDVTVVPEPVGAISIGTALLILCPALRRRFSNTPAAPPN